MSRWWNRYCRGTLQIALLPDRIEFVATGGRFGDGERGVLNVSGPEAGSWEPVVMALGDFLDQPLAKRRKLRIFLSDAWIGYRVLPWDASVTGRQQWECYARAVFQEGANRANDWMMAMEQPWPLRNVMASRMPAGLDLAIHEVAGKRRLKIQSIQSFFVASVNRYKPTTQAGDFWWVAADEFRAVCGLWRSGVGETGFRGWQTVRNQAVGGDFEPIEVVRREEVQMGITDDALPIVVCAQDLVQLNTSERIILVGGNSSADVLMSLAA